MVVLWDFYQIYPLVNVYKTMENHHAMNGKTHFFDWAMFNGYLELPEGTSLVRQGYHSEAMKACN